MTSNNHASSLEDLSDELVRLGYEALFRMPDSNQQIENIWSKPDAPERLLQLTLDDANSWFARFLAAEIIFRQQMFLIRPGHFASLAPVYAKAFSENASGFMSDWGLMSDMKDTGNLGSKFIIFGRESDPPLRVLLDDEREVPYIYPPDFPSQIQTGLRIKDFVAVYLSSIHSIPIQLTEDADERDREIQRLKGLLP